MPTAFMCTACGTEFAPHPSAPDRCPICDDERQYVPATGQGWTSHERLCRTHFNTFRHEGELLGIGVAPAFAINQRALLVPTSAGNILWDCVSLCSPATVELVRARGGIAAIAISHPHYYSAMVRWSEAFGGVPIYLSAADRSEVMRPDPAIVFWEGDRMELAPEATLHRLGGHFDGGTILHWSAGHRGEGAILTGDILQVTNDPRWLGFMRSYPNYIPHGRAAVEKLAARVAPIPFDAVYGAFWDKIIPTEGKAAMDASVARHLKWLEEDIP